jgi:hypothetical protein
MSTDTRALHYIVNKFIKERERIKERLTDGMNERDYFRYCGQAEVFRYMVDFINDTMKRVADDEELADE